jgi:hypothetical protein
LNLCPVVGRVWVDSLFFRTPKQLRTTPRESLKRVVQRSGPSAVMVHSTSFMFDIPDFVGIVSGGEGIKYNK